MASPAEVKTKAIKKATDYCDSKNRSTKVIDVKEIPVRGFTPGGFARADVLFTCE